MAKERVRVEVKFNQDYETKKKGETMSVSRTLAHLLVNVAKVADKVNEVKENAKEIASKAKKTKE